MRGIGSPFLRLCQTNEVVLAAKWIFYYLVKSLLTATTSRSNVESLQRVVNVTSANEEVDCEEDHEFRKDHYEDNLGCEGHGYFRICA